MRRIPQRLLAATSLVIAAGAVVLLTALVLADRLTVDAVFAVAGSAVFTVIGAVIEGRRPGNVIGRINVATGLALALCVGLRLGAEQMDRAPGSLPPAGAVLAVGSSVTFASALIGGSLSLVARYPDGRLPGKVGRLLDRLVVLALGAASLQLFRPGPLEYGWVEAVPNPIGIEALRLVFDLGAASLLVAFGVGMALGIIGLISRYRTSDERVRAQLRWFLAACAIPLGLLVLLFLSSGQLNEWVWNAWLLSFLLVPLAVGIAILRYRLYDIDRIISRTISYGLVTAILAAVFLATNLGMQTLVAQATGASTLAVAASTLFVAAFFQPLRRAIQSPIDRRFNRARVDADRTLAAFGERVRDEVDIERIEDSVRGTTAVALRPTGVGLWLRAERR